MNKSTRTIEMDRIAASWPGTDKDASEIYGNVTDLVEAALDSNFGAVRQFAQTLMMRCGGLAHPQTAARFQDVLKGKAPRAENATALPTNKRTSASLVEEMPWPSTPLFLEARQSQTLDRLVREIRATEALANHGLAVTPRLLLEGPPGTGKTLAAGHLAARMGLPFFVVRLDSVVSSLLGDTARNVRALFEFAEQQPCVLFLDEFDAIAKRRDDGKDVGELKRVVNALLQCLDLSDRRTVVIAATNHADLLDSAVWRRFPYRIRFELPSAELRESLWDHYLGDSATDMQATLLSKLSAGISCSDIAEVAMAARRSAIIDSCDVHVPGVVEALVHLAEGEFILPGTDEMDSDARKNLWIKLEEQFLLATSEIASLWLTTRQNVEKQIKPLRRKGINSARKPDPSVNAQSDEGRSYRRGEKRDPYPVGV